jgi:hypothetical protein
MGDTDLFSSGTIPSGMKQEKKDLPYDRGAHLFSTRCAEAFEATHRATNAKCLLWILRYPVNAENAKELTARLTKIKALKLPISKIIHAEVDASGVAYILMEYEKLSPFMDSTWVPVELEEKFISSIKSIEALHRTGVIIGDIAEHTLLLRENKTITLGSLLGDFDFAAQHTAQLPPAESINFVAPERAVTARPDVASDVYSLGVYAYRLFTGQYPKSPIKKPSSFRSDLPVWVDAVIGSCLQADPSKRFKDVLTMIKVIEESIKSNKPPELSGLWSSAKLEQKDLQKETKEIVKVKAKKKEENELPEQEKARPKVAEKAAQKVNLPSKNTFVWFFALIMGLGIAGFVFLSIGSSKPGSKKATEDAAVNDPIAFVAEYAPVELKESILKLADADLDTQTKLSLLTQINQSQDPVVYEVLVSVVQSSYDAAIKSQAKKYIIERLDLQGLNSTSGLMQDWVSFQAQLSPAATHVFRAVDFSRPVRSRVTSLVEASNKDMILALRFSAALAIDEDDPAFIENLRTLLAKQAPGEDYSAKGIGALLVSHPALSIFLDRDISKALAKFSDQDLTWSLLKAAEGDQPILKELAQEVIRRNILSPFQMIFIGVLVREIQPGQVSHVFDRELVLAAMGKIQSSDLYNFARWDSLESEKVILAICASSPDANVTREAFDILAAKSLRNKLAANFISWVKSGFWEYRARMAKPIAIISMADLATQQELQQALDNLMPFSKGGLFKVISTSDDKMLIKESLSRMGALLSNDDLIGLLSSKNKEIRIEAVRGLKDRNELDVLKAIVKAYDAEKDAEVRKIYNEIHWVTKNRKGF